MKHLKIYFSILILIIAIIGCKKNNDDNNNNNGNVLEYDTQSSEDNALAENTYNDMGSMSDQAQAGTLTSYRPENGASMLSSCATVTLVTGSPNVIKIDFGSNWCF